MTGTSLRCPAISFRAQLPTLGLLLACLVAGALPGDEIRAADWPQWRYGAARGAVSPEALPEQLHLQWAKQLPAPRSAWHDEQVKLQFDTSYEPVAADGRLFVPSMVRDSLTAYALDTGKELWRFYANGPLRFAPVAHQQRVYFGSDDGYLYCVAAESGELIWKQRGGPSDRRVLGNDRLISTWPVRGAPVLHEGTLYFAAGVWPFMGTFIHAIDAETGEVRWTNSGSGADYLTQPHGSPAFAGAAPQGYLAVAGDTLVVPASRSIPAGYDLKTGEFRYFSPGASKSAGGYYAFVGPGWMISGNELFGLAGGSKAGSFNTSGGLLAGKDLLLAFDDDELQAYDVAAEVEVKTVRDRRGKEQQVEKLELKPRWQAALGSRGPERIHLQAGNRVYASDGEDTLYAIQLPAKSSAKAEVVWTDKIEGKVWSMLAADNRLVVVNRAGAIFCFGADAPAEKVATTPVPADAPAQPAVAAETAALAKRLIQAAGAAKGYALVLGNGQAGLCDALLQNSELQLIVLEPDAKQALAARRHWDGVRGGLGERVSVVDGQALASLPPYLANLVVCPAPEQFTGGSLANFLEQVAHVLRPYGGTAIISSPVGERAFATQAVEAGKKLDLPGVEITSPESAIVQITRAGPLPGSSNWTHQNADVGNSLISKESLVKAPLGLLWFGGPSHQDVLPRHGHGPTPQVAGGRLFIEGPDMLRAVDVYTGRLLWQRSLPEVGKYYDNTGHHPGAGAIGSNYVSLVDSVYVAYGREGLRLDAATGETLATFHLPADASGEKPVWGYLGVYEDILLAGSSPVAPFTETRYQNADDIYARYAEGSARLVAMDRQTGEVLWKLDAAYNFRHNAVVAGGGRVYAIDRMSDARLAQLKRRGVSPKSAYRLVALDARTGRVVWETEKDIFGTWLSYNEEHDVLLQAGSQYRDRAKDETGRGMVAYRGKTGEVLWQHDDGYAGPPLLHLDSVLTQGAGFDLLTGAEKLRKNALTGENSPWEFRRNYGCNTVIGCTNLLTFRSAAAGFFDLAGDGGTGNLGGFRSSCTSNLVPADGVLNAPDYTRTCSCAYQLQCSLAMVHMPEAELWTFQSYKWDGSRVRNVGLNFGAPGDRRSAEGTLWLDEPSVGGPSPDLPVKTTGLAGDKTAEPVRYYRYHPTRVSGDSPGWVASSGILNVGSLELTLASGDDAKESASYTVRLHLANFAPVQAEACRFDVLLQGKKVLEDFDLASLGEGRSVVKSFADVQVSDSLEVQLIPRGKPDSASPRTALAGLEVIQQP